VLAANNLYSWDVIGIREGFDGLLAGLPVIELNENMVHDLLARGGTILGAANRGNPFSRPLVQQDGTITHVDVSHEAIDAMSKLRLDALIVAGGDGTMSIAHKLYQLGCRVVGVPKTIDNDLGKTDETFGFDTAVRTATEALEKLQTTAESHHRVMVLEVMGRNAGWIALNSGIAGGADAILIPEIPFHIKNVFEKIRRLRANGRRYSLVVVSEGAAPVDGEQQFYIKGRTEADSRLGGIGQLVGAQIEDAVDAEVRVTVLGHVQRGGQPTPRDRWLSTLFGAEAIRLVADEQWGQMVALQGHRIVRVSMGEAAEMKFVDPDGELVRIARDLGIVLG
jgi:6-phosphofructokinase 1